MGEGRRGGRRGKLRLIWMEEEQRGLAGAREGGQQQWAACVAVTVGNSMEERERACGGLHDGGWFGGVGGRCLAVMAMEVEEHQPVMEDAWGEPAVEMGVGNGRRKEEGSRRCGLRPARSAVWPAAATGDALERREADGLVASGRLGGFGSFGQITEGTERREQQFLGPRRLVRPASMVDLGEEMGATWVAATEKEEGGREGKRAGDEEGMAAGCFIEWWLQAIGRWRW